MIYDYEYFKKEIYKLTQIDLNAYKEKQMKRRIDTLIGKSGAVGYDGYVKLIHEDRERFDEFVNYLTINVSLNTIIVYYIVQRFGRKVLEIHAREL